MYYKSGVITGIQKFSLHDGPGIRTVVFFKGCPLRCPWCSNPETQNTEQDIMYQKWKCIQCNLCVGICPNNGLKLCEDGLDIEKTLCIHCGACGNICSTGAISIKGEEYTVDELMRELKKDQVFYRNSEGGITFSGGEPLVQGEFLKEIARRCKLENFHTSIETTAYGSWEIIEDIAPYIDLFMCDIKIFNEELHRKILGVSNTSIFENIKRLSKGKAIIIIRIPIIPAYTDNEKNINDIARFAAENGIKEINLLPYHNYGLGKYNQLNREYKLLKTPVVNKASLAELKEELTARWRLDVKIGG